MSVSPIPRGVFRWIARALFFVLSLCRLMSAEVRFAEGADIGWASEMESEGYKFYDRAGACRDLLEILQGYKIDAIRLRVWVDPQCGWCGKADVVRQAVRAKNRGMRVMIDFHYSDSWADPGQQSKPAAWAHHSFDALRADVYDHTLDVLTTLKAEGVAVEWVQVGNEIRNGMLWPEGSTAHYDQLAELINRGYDAVKTVYPNARVVVHCHNGYETAQIEQFFDQLKSNGCKYDVVGLSHYPRPADWPERNRELQATMALMVSRFDKEVAICEVGMAANAGPTAREMLGDLIGKLKALPRARGLGLFYWEPQAYNWRHYGLAAWESDGRPTEALEAFGQPEPASLIKQKLLPKSSLLQPTQR